MGTGLGFGFLMAVMVSLALSANVEDRQRLAKDLTTGYITGVEPDPTALKIGISLICSRYDESTGELVTSAWEKYTWKDTRLSWNPDDYNGIQILRVPPKSIWIPDFKLYNTIRPTEERDMTYTIVSNDGTVLWIPTVLYRTPCAVDAGDQSEFHCRIKLGSWVYDADTLKLELMEDRVDRSSYMNDTCPLTVSDAGVAVRSRKYPCCEELYSHVELDLHLNRKQEE